MALFAAALAAWGVAMTLGTLIGARLPQGAGAALVTPTSLAMIRAGFPDAGQRTRAVGLWGGRRLGRCRGRTDRRRALTMLDWQLLFWLNLPMAALAHAGFAAFTYGLRVSLAAAVLILGITAALSLTLHPERPTTHR
jgi:MFS transporter, DHA2 family, methylenomycin A resistance protein